VAIQSNPSQSNQIHCKVLGTHDFFHHKFWPKSQIKDSKKQYFASFQSPGKKGKITRYIRIFGFIV
jgi:hypothetical protein